MRCAWCGREAVTVFGDSLCNRCYGYKLCATIAMGVILASMVFASCVVRLHG